MSPCTPLGLTTPNLGLCKPGDLEEVDWAPALNSNFDLIDAAFSGLTAHTLNVSTSNTPAQNRAAIQAAHDALPAAGGILWLTQYGIHINAAINITKPVLFMGPGTTEVSTPGVFALYLDTASQIGFNVTGKGPFNLQNCSIFGAAGTTHIKIAGPTGSLKGTESVGIDNCVFYAGGTHVLIQAAIFYRITRCLFWNYTVAGVKVQNLLDADQGDSLIGNGCVFNTPAAVLGIIYNSGGGLKIRGNKFLGGFAGVAVDPETTATDPATISDIIIDGNSFENYTGFGIFLTRTAGALQPSQIHIVNNQIAANGFGGNVAIGIGGNGATNAYDRIVIVGNIITQTNIAFQFRRTTNLVISGNLISIATDVFDIDNTVINVTVGVNHYLQNGAFPSFISGTPGAGWLLQQRGLLLTVAQLPAVGSGSQAFASNALGPGDGGFTGYGMAATAGGAGAPVTVMNGNWKVG